MKDFGQIFYTFSLICKSFNQGALGDQMSLHFTISYMILKWIGYQIRLNKCVLRRSLLDLALKILVGMWRMGYINNYENRLKIVHLGLLCFKSPKTQISILLSAKFQI